VKEQLTNNNNLNQSSGFFDFDFNTDRILSRCIKRWYVFVISILLFLAIAFAFNRYSTKIFNVSASILIKENEELSEAEFIIKNALVSNYRNYYNDLYIAKSYPLMQTAIEALDFDIAYFTRGNIKTSEFYEEEMPLKIDIVENSEGLYGESISLNIHDKTTFSLEYLSQENQIDKDIKIDDLVFNDTIQLSKSKILVNLDSVKISPVYFERPFIVRFYDPFKLAIEYSNRIKAEWAEEGASVIILNITGDNPQKERDFLEEYIETYQEYDVNKKNQTAIKSIDFLDEQLEIIGDSLKVYEDQIENFKKQNIITTLDAEAQRLYQKLETLETQKVKQILTENYYKYIIERLEAEQFDGIITPQSVGIEDVVIATLIKELIILKSEIALYETQVENRDNPVYKEKIIQIKQLKSQIIKAIQTAREARDLDKEFLESQIDELDMELRALPSSERSLVKIQRNYKLRENLYVFLLQKRAELGITKASATSNIIKVNPPIIGSLISPKSRLNYFIALSSGFALPLFIFFLIEATNHKIQAKEDIEKITKIPLLGGIGHNPSDGNLAVIKNPKGALAEAFRALRSNLNYFTNNTEKKVFLITSSISGEGKTFTSLNLASVMAMTEKKTLIIGADLRRPKLYDDLQLKNDIGLSQFLSGMTTEEELVKQTSIENLFVLLAGPVPPNPSELLMKKEMGTLINNLLNKFDYIIIDTPPVGLVTDAFILQEYADHVLFLIRQDYTPKQSVIALEDTFINGRIRDISIVFNDIRKNSPGYGYGYGYRYGYGYGRKNYGQSNYYQ